MNQPQRKPVSFKVTPLDTAKKPHYTDADIDVLMGHWDREVTSTRRNMGFVREELNDSRREVSAMKRANATLRRAFFNTLRKKAELWVKWEATKAVCFMAVVIMAFVWVGSMDSKVDRMTDDYQHIVELGKSERAMHQELPAKYGY